MNLRIGQGIDFHCFAEGRPLILGGVRIPHDKGLSGHSDADVLIHAIIDALLGASSMGDIGRHFPDTDLQWKDADSASLLTIVWQLLGREQYEIINLDATVVAEVPRLLPHIEDMRLRLATILGLEVGQVNIKATTSEKMGALGRKEGIMASAVCLLNKVRLS